MRILFYHFVRFNIEIFFYFLKILIDRHKSGKSNKNFNNQEEEDELKKFRGKNEILEF